MEAELIEQGETPEFARFVAQSIPARRAAGRFFSNPVKFQHVSGVKYDFTPEASPSRVIHYVLNVPGGYVTVSVTGLSQQMDESIVESCLLCITID